MKKLFKFGCLGIVALVVLLGVAVALTPAPEETIAAEPTAKSLAALIPTVTPQPTAAPEQAWYSGGTLHASTIAEWQDGSDADQLATAADWYITAREIEGLRPEDEPVLHAVAEAMVICVDELIPTVTDSYDETESASAIALLCAETIAEEMPEAETLEN